MAQASPAKSISNFRMIIGEPRSIDPGLVTDYSIFTYNQFFEQLYRVNSKNQIVWLGAKSMNISKNGLVWTFHLKPSYRWSNGQPVTAADYAYGWLRTLNPKSGSEAATFLYDIKNAEAYNLGKLKNPNKVGIKATGKYTFRVTLAHASPEFRAIAGLLYFAPVPKTIVQKYGKKWTDPAHIATNGPYTVQSWKHDQSMVLVRNRYYGGPRPQIDRVSIGITTQDLCTAQLQAYEANEIDFSTCIPPQDISRVKKSSQFKGQLSPYPLSATVWVQFDNNKAPWNNPLVRRAMALTVNRKDIVAAVTDNTAHATKVLVPSDIVGNNPKDAYTGTVAQARQLLAQAGYPGGKGLPTFTITASADRGQPLIAQLLQQEWQSQLGLHSTINVLEENAYRSWIAARKTQPYDLVVEQWYSDFADPTDWYDDVFLQDFRNMHWVNPQYAALVKKGDLQTNPGKRRTLFRQANRILEQQQPAIALYNPTDLWLVKPNVHNLKHEGVFDMYHIGEARIGK